MLKLHQLKALFHVEMARCQLTLPKISHGNFQPIPPEPELLGAANLLPGLKIQVADVNLVPCYSRSPLHFQCLIK